MNKSENLKEYKKCMIKHLKDQENIEQVLEFLVLEGIMIWLSTFKGQSPCGYKVKIVSKLAKKRLEKLKNESFGFYSNSKQK